MNEAGRQTQKFMGSYPIARFGKGQPILRPGDELAKIHYLIEGTVIQYDISETGSVVIVNSFQPNNFFPLSHVFNPKPINFFFEADSPVTTRVAPREHVYDFISTTPLVINDVLAQSFKASDELLRRVSYAMGGSATSRVVYELLNAANVVGERNADGSIFVRLSENDIAKRTGLSRETVNRMLRSFKLSKTIRSTNQGIQIISVNSLQDSLDNQK